MKISVPNYVEASGPTFSSDITIPVANLPIALYDYRVGCRAQYGCGVEWTMTCMKPSSVSTRVLQLQGRMELGPTGSPEYTITYTFSPYDPIYTQFIGSVRFAPVPAGEFTIEGDDTIYNAVDYWDSHFDASTNQLHIVFQPSLTMLGRIGGRVLYYDMVV